MLKENKFKTLPFIGSFSIGWNKDIEDYFNRALIKPYIDGMESSTRYYEEYRQANRFKIIKDHEIGKKSEIATAYFLHKHFGFTKAKLDFEIRNGQKKGWIPDLEFGNLFPNVHVKSSSNETMKIVGEDSWTFQLKNTSNDFGRDPILDCQQNDLVCFVHMDDESCCKCVIKAIISAKTIFKKTDPNDSNSFAYLDDPRLPKYRGLKKCLNHSTLEKIKSILGL